MQCAASDGHGWQADAELRCRPSHFGGLHRDLEFIFKREEFRFGRALGVRDCRRQRLNLRLEKLTRKLEISS
jgi:hypothetical protein